MLESFFDDAHISIKTRQGEKVGHVAHDPNGSTKWHAVYYMASGPDREQRFKNLDAAEHWVHVWFLEHRSTY